MPAWCVVELTTQDATLIAAGIAAVASLAKLLADALSARGTATRAAHRTVLQPHLAGLATSVHGVVAGAVVAHRRLKEARAGGNALDNSRSAATALKTYRLEVKYALPGIEEPLRTLTRAPDWIATYKGDPSGDGFVEGLQCLSHMVDDVISRSYRRGRPPTRWEQWRLARATKRVRDAWEGRFGRDEKVDE
jgi:hypothetical protein